VNISQLSISYGSSGSTGISISYRNNIRIKDCRINFKSFGIHVLNSNNIHIINCSLGTGDTGIFLSESTNVTISNNKLTYCGLRLEGKIEQLKLTNVENNLVNDKPLVFKKNQNNFIIDDLDIGQIILINCTSFEISNIDIIQDATSAAMILYSSGGLISDCNIKNNKWGVELENSNNIDINNCDLSSNSWWNCVLDFSSNNTLSDCNLKNSGTWGLGMFSSSHDNHVYKCDISSNFFYGVSIGNSNRNNISNCIIDSNRFMYPINGHGIDIKHSEENIIVDCNISNNRRGIMISSDSENNYIYHNNLLNNDINANDGGNNIWDDDYPSGGNYWSNFNEPSEGAYDDYSGANQNITGSDGIVDSSYSIPAGSNLDNYPLLYPWSPNQPPIADIGGPYEGNEGTQITLNASFSSDPDGDSLTYAWDLDDDGEYDDATGINPIYTWCDDFTGIVSVEVSDGTDTDAASTTVTVNNIDPIITGFTASPGLVEVNGTVTFNATFTDPGCDGWIASFDWDNDGIYDKILNSVTSPIQETNSFTETGVYTIKFKLEDDDEGFDSEIYQYVVVYNSTGAFVTGGGWIDSPEGAYPTNPNLTGTANFGFVSKYKKGNPTPIGNTQFKFKLADLDFKSDSYDWLVVTNHKAMYKGTGTVNGEDNYGFMLSAIDEDLTPSTDVDLFRIKIWDKDNNDEVIYDNQLGEDEDEDPCTEIGGGNIKIHKVT
jgi:parallel beta-helix repeat protein